ncbi:hypothetical protein QF043_004813 [Pseudomonas sp. W3I7]|nr:hypothetical protein [Pseudomonas sp. W3I7]
MLQRLLFGLITVTSLTLVGCANSPQQLSPQPKVTAQLAPVGHGQPVSVRVVDGRPSPTLGSRGGLYPETALISVQGQDVLPKLQAQAEAAVRLLGFTPANSPGAPQLTITLAELKYQSPKEGLYVTEASIGATFKSDVSAGTRPLQWPLRRVPEPAFWYVAEPGNQYQAGQRRVERRPDALVQRPEHRFASQRAVTVRRARNAPITGLSNEPGFLCL